MSLNRTSSMRALRYGLAALALAMGSAAAGPAVAQDLSGPVEGAIEYGYWGNAARAEVTDAVARAFEAAHPNTQVQTTVAEYFAYVERLTVQAASGELPCVTQVQSTFLATYATRNVLRPLDDLLEAGVIDAAGIPEGVLDAGRIDGTLYMFPTGIFMRLVAVNAAMAEQYGIEPAPARGTFEEFRQWLAAAQEKLPDGVYAAENEGANLFTLYSWIAGHGANFFEGNALGFDQQLLADFFRYWDDLAKAGIAVPADRLEEQFGPRETTPLSRGIALTATRDLPHRAPTEATLASANLPAEIEFVRNPVEEGVTSGNVPGTNGLSISNSCTNVPTAAKFIDFFSNDPTAVGIFQSANGVVVSQAARDALIADAATDEAVKGSIEELSAAFADGDVASVSYPSGYQALTPILRRIFESVALSGVSPEDAASAFFAEAEQALR